MTINKDKIRAAAMATTRRHDRHYLFQSNQRKAVSEMEELNKGYEFTKAQIAELESLRAWKAEIEKQEPVGYFYKDHTGSLRQAHDDQFFADHKPLFAAPVVSPDVGLLKLTIEQKVERIGLLESLLNSALDENQSLKSELEAARKEDERFKTARMIATNHMIHRYLMSNADGRWDGAEKALRHEELCTYYVGLHLGITALDLVRGRCAEVGECLYQAVHTATQELTGYLDEKIGFPLSGRPDYDNLAPLFFEQFDELALKAIKQAKGAV